MGLLKATLVVATLGCFALLQAVRGADRPSRQPQAQSWPLDAKDQVHGRSLFQKLFNSDADLNNTCGVEVQQLYKCTEAGCQDLAAGYINYIYFQKCIVPQGAAQVFSGLLLVVWMLFLLHCVETTTDHYFCASLQVVVRILNLSPNVAGVTFLAVGNAACDVIASIAAFATGVPKVGVGTTLGAGIFVTTAVVAAVSFVADVRLARRSFMRDVLFFLCTVLYLLYTTLDGIITNLEAIGFMVIYLIFLAAVFGGRYIRGMRTEDDGHSIGGSTGTEHAIKTVETDGEDAPTGASVSVAKLTDAQGGYQSAASSSTAGSSSAADSDGTEEKRRGLLSALEAARREAMTLNRDREIEALTRENTFRAEHNDEERGGLSQGGRERVRTDSGAGTPNGVDRGRSMSSFEGEAPGDRFGGLSRGKSYAPRGSFVDDLPTKPSAWTRTFHAAIGEAEDGEGSGRGEDPMVVSSATGSTAKKSKKSKRYEAYQMPTYHKRKIAKELAKRLADRGIHHLVKVPEGVGGPYAGKTVDIADLAVTDPDAAADILSKAASAITATAVKSGGGLSFVDAAHVATESSGLLTGAVDGGTGGTTGVDGSVGGRDASTQAHRKARVGAEPGADLLAVLPKETIKPVADMYLRARVVIVAVGPFYHSFMHTMERPVTIARHLTVPLIGEHKYRRTLILLNMPCGFALFAFIVTTHIIPGTAYLSIPGSSVQLPVMALAATMGLALSGFLAATLPSTRKGDTIGEHRKLSSSALLSPSKGYGSTGAVAPAASELESAADAAVSGGHGAGGQGAEGAADSTSHPHHHKSWYSPFVKAIVGPEGADPLPKGPIYIFFMVFSFVMGLFWLLLIANEIVGTALCFGKVLAIPDTVMGLVVLAVGNSINDLAASVTIARDGFPTMAVAGAYAGPMFNIVGGIGLPMLIYTANGGDYAIGKDTPLVQAAFATLSGSLLITLIWVPMAGFRITHRIGRFLLAWFFGFILLVIIMGSIPGLTGDDDVTLSPE